MHASHRAFLVFAAATAALASSPARADSAPDDSYSRSHFYIGFGGAGVAVLDQSGPHTFLQHGGGFDLFLGGRLGKWTALELNWQPSFHENQKDIFGNNIPTIGLDAITLDVKIFFLHGFVQPYFTAGVGAYLLGDPFRPNAEGPGYQIGGGIDFWLGHHVTLGIKLQYRGVELYDFDRFGDNTYVSLFNGEGNLGIHF